MTPNDIFFSDNGLTSTSANYIANLAKEYVAKTESEVQNIQFYTSKITLIGTANYSVLQTGIDEAEMRSIPDKLAKISQAKSLIAWLREAIKAKKDMLEKLEDLSDIDCAAIFGEMLPTKPCRRRTRDEDSFIAKLSVKERNRIYALQTEAATIGKYIHPDGKFANARKEFLLKLRSPNDVKENGRDTLLYSYEPTVADTALDDVYFSLQKRHREVQAQLNGIMHEITNKVREDQLAAESEYASAIDAYTMAKAAFDSRIETYKKTEAKRIGALKIIIPNDLLGIYETINSIVK